ncbi:MAG: creatininase family protein [Flavobacteriaceae bacterium]|nr:creatininase family protein [Flavobacteriaceae bacterium]
MNKIKPYILSETNWKTIKVVKYSVAVLPWGATEAHNYHLPYGTDNYLAEGLAEKSGSIAWDKGAKVCVLPVIPFGVNTGQMDIPFCMNMNPSTQLAILTDIIQVLNMHNIHKLVILNAHGGNDFKPMIRELSLIFPTVFVCAVNWWQAADTAEIFEYPDDHAGEMETSSMLYMKPEFVLPLSEAGKGKGKKFRIKELNEKWTTVQRKWTSVTNDTGVGNPEKSTAEKGKIFVEVAAQTIGKFLFELHEADLNDMYM